MGKTPIKLIYILFLIQSGLNVSAQEPDWVLIDSSNGVKSYRCPGVNGQPDTHKAETILNCRLDIIAVILKDFENYPAWMPDCVKLELIEMIDDNNMILYYQHHTPWPVHDRDAVLHVSNNLDPKQRMLSITSLSVQDSRFPPSDNFVHMKKMEAHWQIQYLDENHTEISYQVFSDPGGLIPISQVNFFSRHLPRQTLLGLKKMVRTTKYIKMTRQSKEKSIVDTFSSESDQAK